MQQNFARQRMAMVDQQLRLRGIDDPRVLAVMDRVPRHAFLPAEMREHAYEDRPLPIGEGQTMSQPYIVGLMTQMLELEETDKVLEIGTGSGYQAAVLGLLAREVFTIERHGNLARRAQLTLERLGFKNVHVLHGDGTLGWPQAAPYDAILVTAGGPQVPPSLKEQLAVGGRLVCPVGSRETQQMVRFIRTDDDLIRERSIDCMFVPLIGEEGWSDPRLN
ncbi:MAG: protein-L-isoaspartate(D-aspartate) O-methyltransferase [Candidatus Hydrogenedentales bacterium]